MIIKSFEINNNFKITQRFKIILFYGENEGLKKDFKNKIRNEYKNNEVLNYFQEELITNKKLLINELANQSLFSQSKLIFINQVNDKFLNFIEDMKDQVDSNKICIFSSLLDKKSKLRSVFEKDKDLAVVPCYNDTEQTLIFYVREKLKHFKGLNSQIINFICSNSNYDRLKIINELEKIESYFLTKSINLDDIQILLNESKNEDLDQLKERAFLGDTLKTNKLLGETYFDPQEMNYFISKITFKLQRLLEISIQRKENKNVSEIINNIKPAVFWKEKPILTEQARKWDEEKITEFLNKTYKVEKDLRNENITKKEIIVKSLLQEICVSATTSS